MDYLTITSYTTEKHKTAVMEDVRGITAEDVPMIIFIAPNDLNIELRNWIDETLA